MILSQTRVVDQIAIDEHGNVSVREATRILRDGVCVSETYHRVVLRPGDDVSNQEPRVQAHAKTAWTEDVIAARRAENDAARKHSKA